MLNQVQLIGRIGKDPEVATTSSGTKVAKFSVATSESWNSNGQKQEHTEWHNVVAWSKLAEIVEQYYAKGYLVYVGGKIRSRSWEDRDGNKRYMTEIVADKCWILSKPNGSSGSGSGSSRSHEPQDDPIGITDDDIPFGFMFTLIGGGLLWKLAAIASSLSSVA